MDEFAPVDVDIVLKDPRMQRVAESLRALIRPSIRLHMRSAEEGEELPLGGTRFGGEPDLPVGTPWPSGHVEVPPPTEAFRAANVDHGLSRDFRLPPENGTFSLPFIAQIRLSEVKTCDVEKRLPASGMLYFFFNSGGFVSDVGGNSVLRINSQKFACTRYGLEDPAAWHVLFVPEEQVPLYRAEPPSDIPEDQCYRTSVPTAVFSETTLPQAESCIGSLDNLCGELTLTTEEWDIYAAQLMYVIGVNPAHRILGYSDDCQQIEMKRVFNRLRSRLFPELPAWESLTAAEQRQEHCANCLLLQVDANDGYVVLGWPLYFFIREADLAAQDFTRVWAKV